MTNAETDRISYFLSNHGSYSSPSEYEHLSNLIHRIHKSPNSLSPYKITQELIKKKKPEIFSTANKQNTIYMRRIRKSLTFIVFSCKTKQRLIMNILENFNLKKTLERETKFKFLGNETGTEAY